MTRYTLTKGRDRILAAGPRVVIEAASDTLSPGDVIIAAPASDAVLALTGGSDFDLAAPAALRGIDTVIDQSVGDSRITLRAGLDLTLHLGDDRATVEGAANADTIIGGDGYDTIILGSAAERFTAGSGGASVVMQASDAGAHIAGGNLTALKLVGAPGKDVILGAEVQGIAILDIASAGLRVNLRDAGIATVALSAAQIFVTLAPATTLVTDYAGGNTIRLTAAGQTLQLPYASLLPGLPADHVEGFTAGDAIDVDLPYGAEELLDYNPVTGELTLTDQLSGAAASVYLTPGPETFRLAADQGLPNGDTGTLITLIGAPSQPPNGAPSGAPPCFAEGTRILTSAGLKPVEALAIGDRLVTISGEHRRLRWIGTRLVHCRTHPDPTRVWPVRIAAGAFADRLPERDVNLSPDHAVFVDGALVPVRHLVNGASIRQIRTVRVRYFHLELATHDVVLAEGLPVETYLDTGNRHHFANGGNIVSFHADFGPGPAARPAYAPFLTGGPALHTLRARLLDRLDPLFHATTTDPDLHLVADGQRIWCQRIQDPRAGDVFTFWLPPQPRDVRIVSRAAAPADCTADNDDLRRLGVALTGITLRGARNIRRLGPDGDAWGPGAYTPEQDEFARWRWTNGAATLDPSLWRGIDGPFRLDLHLLQTLTYRLDAPPRPSRPQAALP